MAKKVNKAYKIVLIALVAVILIVGIALIAKSASSKTQTLNATDYKIGSLNSQGEYIKDTSSIVTRKMYNVEGMRVSLEDDAMITYQLYFFNKDGDFLAKTDSVAAAPEGAHYFKVVITPTNDAEVSLNEVRTYAAQLEVRFAK